MSWEIFDKLCEDYDRWFERSPGKEMFALERRCLEDALRGANKPWMEVGVGTGRFAEALGVEYGIDASAPMLEKARARGIEVVEGRAESLPYEGDSFGAVLMVVTICFLEDPLASIRECFRTTQPGGVLAVGIVPADSSWGRDYQKKKESGHPYYSNARFYTVSQVEQMGTSAGYEVDGVFSTLFEGVGKQPIGYYPPVNGRQEEAGFVVIRLLKPHP